jgi:hypothetical protein
MHSGAESPFIRRCERTATFRYWVISKFTWVVFLAKMRKYHDFTLPTVESVDLR